MWELIRRPKVYDPTAPKIMEKGCCEELTKAIAVFDHDYIQKYFTISKEARKNSKDYLEL